MLLESIFSVYQACLTELHVGIILWNDNLLSVNKIQLCIAIHFNDRLVSILKEAERASAGMRRSIRGDF